MLPGTTLARLGPRSWKPKEPEGATFGVALPPLSRAQRVRSFLRRVYDKAGDDNIFFLAGAISFNVLVAIVPLFLFAVGVTGLVLTARFGDPTTVIVTRLLDYLPAVGGGVDLVGTVNDAIDGLLRGRTGLTAVGAVLLVWLSTRLIADAAGRAQGGVRCSSGPRHHRRQDFRHPGGDHRGCPGAGEPRHHYHRGGCQELRRRCSRGDGRGGLFRRPDVDDCGVLSLRLGSFPGPLRALGITTTVEAAKNFGVDALGVTGEAVSFVDLTWTIAVSYLSAWVLFLGLYRYLPARSVPWKTAVVAATFTATLSEALKYAFSWYATSVADFGSTYGNLITMAVLFSWIYYVAIVFILGGEVAQVWTMRRALLASRAAARFGE